jgi:hypothetical protein
MENMLSAGGNSGADNLPASAAGIDVIDEMFELIDKILKGAPETARRKM